MRPPRLERPQGRLAPPMFLCAECAVAAARHGLAEVMCFLRYAAQASALGFMYGEVRSGSHFSKSSSAKS